MAEFIQNVELAIELAARDIARVVVDSYGPDIDYARAKRNVHAMISSAIRGSTILGQKVSWTGPVSDPWIISAADVGSGGIEKDRFDSAIQKWWASLDEKGKLGVILGPAGHHDSEYINNIRQKYQDKPEATLMKEVPELHRFYREESGATNKPTATPSPAPRPESLEAPVSAEPPAVQ